MYPRIIINTLKLKENINTMLKITKENNIPFITMVVKAFSGNLIILKEIEKTNIESIGDSRIENLKLYKDLSFKEKMLLRIPMLSEVKDVIKYADTSLNSEIKTLKALNLEAKKQNKKHNIIIMFDLGDLREGIYYTSNYLPKIQEIIKLKNLKLIGIGTNLTCYGGLIPNKIILNRLIEIKKNIENNLNIKLDIISGGNSSSTTLFGKGIIPNEINHLRLGESILFGKETSYSNNIYGFNYDIYQFEAEIIEVQKKPSFPDGTVSINSFGEKINIQDKGLMNRAILAIGKQDIIFKNLFPINRNISIIGGSSDHLIIDIKNDNLHVGDIIKFNINYPALLHLMNSDYVKKIYK